MTYFINECVQYKAREDLTTCLTQGKLIVKFICKLFIAHVCFKFEAVILLIITLHFVLHFVSLLC